jgi:predicted dehydrogenase
MEIFGTDGAMRIDHRGEVCLATNGDPAWTTIDTELTDNILGVPNTGFARGFMAFAPKIVEAIRNGSTRIEHAATFEDGVKVQRVLDAARKSNSDGVAVNLPNP